MKAAEHGVWTGNVLAAAYAFIDAATMAHEDGDSVAAAEAADRAELLSNSPFLSPVQRMYLLGRIESVQNVEAEG